ncbi:MAG: hypothetical protein ACYCU7_19030 [Acidimicrobiales bacterium]
MDFDWPQGEVWHGYLNPHYRKCPKCDNGYTVAREYLNGIVHLLLIAGADSIKGSRHPWLDGVPHMRSEAPSPDMAELSAGLAGRKPDPFFGHDSIDRWIATKKIIEAAALDPETWGICTHCKGDAVDPETKEAYEAWQKFEPPTGEGYQLWETTSEGSPISPVFATLDDLCQWAAENATTFARCKATASEWRSMLDAGFVHHREGGNVFI